MRNKQKEETLLGGGLALGLRSGFVSLAQGLAGDRHVLYVHIMVGSALARSHECELSICCSIV